jgi:hypothetical protein
VTFALSSVRVSIHWAVACSEGLDEAIRCIAVGARGAQASCFDYVCIFRRTTPRTSRCLLFHDGMRSYHFCGAVFKRAQFTHSERQVKSFQVVAAARRV